MQPRVYLLRRGGPRPSRRDWAPWELALLGEFPDGEVAERTGRSNASVTSMKRKKNIEPLDQ